TGETQYVDELGLAGFLAPIKIERVESTSPNGTTLRDDDVLLKVGSIDVPTFAPLRKELAAHRNEPIDLTVLRDGQRASLVAKVDRDGRLGIRHGIANETNLIAAAIDESIGAGREKSDPPVRTATPALGIDVLPRSSFVSIAGAPVSNWAEARERLKAAT